jgi:hypothetical protein
MNRRSFMSMIAGILGFLGIDKLAKAEPSKSDDKVYKYCRLLRKCDEAMMDEFKNLVVMDEKGESHPIPIVWADESKVDTVLELGSDKSEHLIVDKIKLPLLNMSRGDLRFPDNKIKIDYYLSASTLYQEDMNQILEQIISKFNPVLENKAGVVAVGSAVNNFKNKSDSNMIRMNKYHFHFILEAKDRP